MIKRNSKRKQVILGIFIAVIMVSSILGFSINSGDEESTATKETYNGYDFFKNQQDLWVVYIDNGYYGFDYLPEEIQDIDFESFNLVGGKVYLSQVPEQRTVNFNYAMNKIYSTLANKGFTAVVACSEEAGCPDIPLVDCNNEFPVISLIESEDNKIYKQDNCLILECDSDSISKCADRLNYDLLGVM